MQRQDSGTWSSREAYLLALVCLLSGLVLGYLFHGSGAPVASTVAAAQPAGPAAQPSMPSAQDLTPLAAPLLAALKVDPNNYETLVQLGNLYYDHHVFPEAIQYYGRALTIRPNDPNVRTDLGTAFWYAGFPEKAVAEYEKSLAADPQHANTLFNLGVVRLEGLKDAQGAIAAWEKLLAANPSVAQRGRAMELIAQARQQAGAK
jgi:cytochrome c-type biogenesis protein CcmH/NrfG